MATMNQPTITRIDFVCPLCGAHSTDATIAYAAKVVEVRPVVELWKGGPVVDDVGALPEPHVVGNTLSTDACADRFSMWLWDMVLVAYPDGHGELLLTPTNLNPDAD
jgi:hypothetical protein